MAMTMKKVSVILPVYNEAAALPEFTRRLFDTLGHCPPGYVFEVIYSTDKSTVLHELSSRFPLKALFLSRPPGFAGRCDGPVRRGCGHHDGLRPPAPA